MIISLLTFKICKWWLHSYIDDDSKNVNSNWLKLFTTETYFSFYRIKTHDHSKKIERESYKIFGMSLVCEVDFTFIKIQKISLLNYPSCILLCYSTYSPQQLGVCKLNYVIFFFCFLTWLQFYAYEFKCFFFLFSKSGDARFRATLVQGSLWINSAS